MRSPERVKKYAAAREEAERAFDRIVELLGSKEELVSWYQWLNSTKDTGLDNVRLVHKKAYKICPQFARVPASLKGYKVKIAFQSPGCDIGENMWVAVTRDDGKRLVGSVCNDPVVTALKYGDYVEFKRKDILDYYK